MIFVATKKGRTTNFFSPFSFVAVFGYGTRDPGSGINFVTFGFVVKIPDHEYELCALKLENLEKTNFSLDLPLAKDYLERMQSSNTKISKNKKWRGVIF